MLSSRARRPLKVKFPAHGVWAGESRHAKGFVMPEASHDFTKLLYVISGAGWLDRENLRAPLQAGDVVLVPADCRHRILDQPRRPLSLYVVCLRNDAVAALPGAKVALSHYRHFGRPAWGADFRDAVRRLLQEQTLAWPGGEALAWSAAWAAVGWVWRMTAHTSSVRMLETRGADPARARVAAYAEGLKSTFAQVRDLESTAAGLGLGRRRFTDLFREVAGVSWKQAVRRCQLDHARLLLKTTGRSILSIGYECGFSDVTSFHRAFRAAEHTAPARWRARQGRAR